MLASIIVTAYIQTPFQAHMTMASIANVTRYTDPEDYELILVSSEEKFPVRDDYHVLKIDDYVKTNCSYTAAMNLGANRAHGDVFVFLQNDVFVWEGWLAKMRWYIEHNLADCVIPDQVPRDRRFVMKSWGMTMEEGMKYGSRDAGCLMITKDAFWKIDGWNEELTLLCEKDFYQRMANAGIRQVDTCKVMITHIMAATNLHRLYENPREYEEMMANDADKLK